MVQIDSILYDIEDYQSNYSLYPASWREAADIGAETKRWSKVRGSDALQQAIKAVKEGGMSHSVAARMFGISRCGH